MATTVDEILVRFLGDTTQFDRAVNRFGRGITRIGKLGTVAGGAGTAFFGGIAAAAVKAAGSLEQTQVAFRTLLGSAQQANTLIKQMQNFARRTPFQVTEVENAAKRLLAMGFAAKEIIPTLKSVGDITAGIGIEGGRFERIIHNLAQVRTQGVLTSRELRDFAVNGVPLLDKLVETMNRARSEGNKIGREDLRDMITRRQVTDTDVLRAFQEMTSKGGQFYDLMFEQSKTFYGMWSNIKDSLTITFREMGMVLLPVARKVTKVILDFMETLQKLSPRIKAIITYTVVLAAALSALTTAIFIGITGIGLMVHLLPSWFALMGGIAGVFTTAAGAVVAFLGPWGLFTAGISGGAAAIGAFFVNWKKLWTDSISVAAQFGRSVLGFFWNIGENWRILTSWMKTNWIDVFKTASMVASLGMEAVVRSVVIGVAGIATIWDNLWSFVWVKRLIWWAGMGLLRLVDKMEAIGQQIVIAIATGGDWKSLTTIITNQLLRSATSGDGMVKQLKDLWADTIKKMSAELKKTMPDFNLDTSGMTKALDDFLSDFGQFTDDVDLEASALERTLDKIRNMLLGGGKFHISEVGLFDTRFGGFMAAGRLPGRAEGGPIRPGQSYIVGENGPEIFRSKTSGWIENRQQMRARQRAAGNVPSLSVQVSERMAAAQTRLMSSPFSRAMKDEYDARTINPLIRAVSGGDTGSGTPFLNRSFTQQVATLEQTLGPLVSKLDPLFRKMLQVDPNALAYDPQGSQVIEAMKKGQEGLLASKAALRADAQRPRSLGMGGVGTSSNRVEVASAMKAVEDWYNVIDKSKTTFEDVTQSTKEVIQATKLVPTTNTQLGQVVEDIMAADTFEKRMARATKGAYRPLSSPRPGIGLGAGASPMIASIPFGQGAVGGGAVRGPIGDEKLLAARAAHLQARREGTGYGALAGRGRISGRVEPSGRIHGRATNFYEQRRREREARPEFVRRRQTEGGMTKEERTAKEQLKILQEINKSIQNQEPVGLNVIETIGLA